MKGWPSLKGWWDNGDTEYWGYHGVVGIWGNEDIWGDRIIDIWDGGDMGIWGGGGMRIWGGGRDMGWWGPVGI